MSNYYESNAERYAAETISADMSEQYQRFLPLLKDGVKLLDVGSGSGRDACYFQKQGYQVTALEPSKNLCREIRKVFSGEIVCSDIQSYQPTERYDGIWACASLIHLQEEVVLQFFEKIDQYLDDNGIIEKGNLLKYLNENCFTAQQKTFEDLMGLEQHTLDPAMSGSFSRVEFKPN